MNDSEHTINERQGSATADSSRALNGAKNQEVEQAINGLRAILSQIDDLSTSLRTWSGSTLDLFLLEMKVNVAAARQIVMFSIIFYAAVGAVYLQCVFGCGCSNVPLYRSTTVKCWRVYCVVRSSASWVGVVAEAADALPWFQKYNRPIAGGLACVL